MAENNIYFYCRNYLPVQSLTPGDYQTLYSQRREHGRKHVDYIDKGSKAGIDGIEKSPALQRSAREQNN